MKTFKQFLKESNEYVRIGKGRKRNNNSNQQRHNKELSKIRNGRPSVTGSHKQNKQQSFKFD